MITGKGDKPNANRNMAFPRSVIYGTVKELVALFFEKLTSLVNLSGNL